MKLDLTRDEINALVTLIEYVMDDQSSDPFDETEESVYNKLKDALNEEAE